MLCPCCGTRNLLSFLWPVVLNLGHLHWECRLLASGPPGSPSSYSSLGVKFSGVKCIHSTGQPSPLSIFSTFSSSQRETLHPFENNSPSSSPGHPPPPPLVWSFSFWLILLSISSQGSSIL